MNKQNIFNTITNQTNENVFEQESSDLEYSDYCDDTEEDDDITKFNLEFDYKFNIDEFDEITEFLYENYNVDFSKSDDVNANELFTLRCYDCFKNNEFNNYLINKLIDNDFDRRLNRVIIADKRLSDIILNNYFGNIYLEFNEYQIPKIINCIDEYYNFMYVRYINNSNFYKKFANFILDDNNYNILINN